jgi:hypothetical protein
VTRHALLFALSLSLLSTTAHALPIDWHGVFGADTTLIDNYRRVKTKDQNVVGIGSQEVDLAAGGKSAASFQSYVFRLNPVMIVNDSATLMGEITSGYARGGRFGESPNQSLEPGFANSLYMYNVSDSNNSLVLNKFYAEIYADTATYVIGRHSSDWGLGAVVNSGDGAWDRHTFVRDGITMKIRLGNFRLEPYWSKIGSTDSLTRSSRLREYGFSLLYDNLDNDLTFGLLYSVKTAAAFEDSLRSRLLGDAQETTLPNSQVKLLDLYFKKAFGDLSFGVEVPLLSDSLGNLLGGKTSMKGKAFIFESNYRLSNSWRLNLFAGQISGDPASANSFEAMYLNPNYQISNLLFRYNLRAVADPNNISIYDSYMTNAKYFKFGATYTTEKWTWDTGLLWAKANEVATTGNRAFDHSRNRLFDALDNQSKDLGLELDLNFNYQWNNEISVGGAVGYLFTGDYFAFTNDPTRRNETENSLVLQLRTAIEF